MLVEVVDKREDRIGRNVHILQVKAPAEYVRILLSEVR